jgi:hypothetical protein
MSFRFLFSLGLGLIGGLAFGGTERPPAVTRAPEWTSLFERTSGWLGADGIYSIPLNSYDAALGPRSSLRTLFVFSDTRVGEADPRTLVISDHGMPSHSAAILDGTAPRRDAITFHFGEHADGGLGHVFTGSHAWLNDGIAIGQNVFLTAFAEKDWKPVRLDLITLPLVNGRPDFQRVHVQPGVPLLYKDESYDILFGVALMDLSESSGAPQPDGYVYAYGYRDSKQEGSRKDAVVARVRREEYADPARWRFWDGRAWRADISAAARDAATLQRRVSAEFSVTPVSEGLYRGKYLMVYCRDVQTRDMMIAVGDTPTGPFGEGILIYRALEPETYNPFNGNTAYTYNAKAHPHLSPPGRLLISYNVNQGGSLPKTTEVYRPRFLWIDLHRHAEAGSSCSGSPQNLALGKTATASSNGALAAHAVDGKAEHRSPPWRSADSPGPHWIAVDLGRPVAVTRYVIKHASVTGLEPTVFNTRDFCLQGSLGATAWRDLDTVTGAAEAVTMRTLGAPATVRHVRLAITRPSQSDEPVARIQELELY